MIISHDIKYMYLKIWMWKVLVNVLYNRTKKKKKKGWSYLLKFELKIFAAFGSKEFLYLVVLTLGSLNRPVLSIFMLSNSGLKGCVSSLKIVFNFWVIRFSVSSVRVSCSFPTVFPALLKILSNLSLSPWVMLLPHTVAPEVKTPDIVAE